MPYCENCGKEVKDSEVSYYSSSDDKKHLLCPVCFLKYEYKNRKIITIDRYKEKRQKEDYEIYMKRLAEGHSDKSARAGLTYLESHEKKQKDTKKKKVLREKNS